MQLSERIIIDSFNKEKYEGELEIVFDDPPGPTPARIIQPLSGLEDGISLLDEIEKVEKLEVSGQGSHAFTGESYAILWFALGGIATGVVNAIGQDIWDVIKKAFEKIMKNNSAKRNVFEVCLSYQDYDVILHYESRESNKITDMIEEADSLLEELKTAIAENKSLLENVETIELRRNKDGTYNCKFYTYKRTQKILEAE